MYDRFEAFSEEDPDIEVHSEKNQIVEDFVQDFQQQIKKDCISIFTESLESHKLSSLMLNQIKENLKEDKD